jgi:hypothetical protein
MAMVLGTCAIANDIKMELDPLTYPEEFPIQEPTETTPEEALAMPTFEP